MLFLRLVRISFDSMFEACHPAGTSDDGCLCVCLRRGSVGGSLTIQRISHLRCELVLRYGTPPDGRCSFGFPVCLFNQHQLGYFQQMTRPHNRSHALTLMGCAKDRIASPRRDHMCACVCVCVCPSMVFVHLKTTTNNR